MPRGRKRLSAIAKPGCEIFDLGGPVRRDRKLDAGARGPAGPPQEGGFGGAGGDDAAGKLGSLQPVIAPGEAAGAVHQEAVEVVADAGPRGAEIEHRVVVGRQPIGRRRQRLAAGERVRGRSIGFEADQPVRRQHVIVAGLHAEDVTAGALERVELIEQIERSRQRGRCRAGVGR